MEAATEGIEGRGGSQATWDMGQCGEVKNVVKQGENATCAEYTTFIFMN